MREILLWIILPITLPVFLLLLVLMIFKPKLFELWGDY